MTTQPWPELADNSSHGGNRVRKTRERVHLRATGAYARREPEKTALFQTIQRHWV